MSRGKRRGARRKRTGEEEPLPTGGREVGSRSHRHRPGLVQPTVGGGGGGGGNGGNVGGGFPSVWPLGASDTMRSSSPFGSTAASSTLSNGAPHAELAAASAGLSVKRMRASPYGGRIGGGGGGAAGGAGGADAAADWSLLAQPLPTRRSAALAALRSSPRACAPARGRAAVGAPPRRGGMGTRCARGGGGVPARRAAAAARGVGVLRHHRMDVWLVRSRGDGRRRRRLRLTWRLDGPDGGGDGR